jgi:histidinol-phosphatase (PHP family)
LTVPWLISLHGGHSSAYCDHAMDTLRDMLDAAVAKGFTAFGVSEHCPRLGDQYLYPHEKVLGWTVQTQIEKFEQYCSDIQEIARAYAGRLRILRAFETEAVPHERYIDLMLGYRKSADFDYMVGSVHHVNGIMIDYDKDTFNQLARSIGGVEPLAIRYYEIVGEMVTALRPEVVGHFDLVRKYAPGEESVGTPAIRDAAFRALERVKETGGILDINTAGYRKGIGRPYVSPWLLEAAKAMEIPVCFGDDSHSVADVGAGIPEARDYLLAHGIEEIHPIGAAGPVSLRS